MGDKSTTHRNKICARIDDVLHKRYTNSLVSTSFDSYKTESDTNFESSKIHIQLLANTMSQQGAALQSYNNELVKCKCKLINASFFLKLFTWWVGYDRAGPGLH